MSSAFCHRTPDALVSPPARAKSPHGDTNRRAVVLSMDDGFQVLYDETPAVPAVGFRIEERLMPTPSRVATPVSNEEWSKNLMCSSPQDLPPLPPIPSHLEALFTPPPAPVSAFPPRTTLKRKPNAPIGKENDYDPAALSAQRAYWIASDTDSAEVYVPPEGRRPLRLNPVRAQSPRPFPGMDIDTPVSPPPANATVTANAKRPRSPEDDPYLGDSEQPRAQPAAKHRHRPHPHMPTPQRPPPPPLSFLQPQLHSFPQSPPISPLRPADPEFWLEGGVFDQMFPLDAVPPRSKSPFSAGVEHVRRRTLSALSIRKGSFSSSSLSYSLPFSAPSSPAADTAGVGFGFGFGVLPAPAPGGPPPIPPRAAARGVPTPLAPPPNALVIERGRTMSRPTPAPSPSHSPAKLKAKSRPLPPIPGSVPGSGSNLPPVPPLPPMPGMGLGWTESRRTADSVSSTGTGSAGSIGSISIGSGNGSVGSGRGRKQRPRWLSISNVNVPSISTVFARCDSLTDSEADQFEICTPHPIAHPIAPHAN